ncbi:fimbrial protein [Serratia fonticola]|uniref:fimbrial protein n=1 Tax=Serratia fonticola TaxID=47917 RepID=UPI0021AD6E31|nr:fimbrial protein [Serratia fonticola]
MKKNLIAVAVLVSSAFCVSANAAEGQVNFTGSLIPTGCTVTNSPANPLEVFLGNLPVTSFGAAGTTSASKVVALKVTACPATTANVTFDGTYDSGNPQVLALTAGGATGVGIQLLDNADNVVTLGTASAPYTLTAGDNTLNFKARYIATVDSASMTVGAANSIALFNISYN